MRYLTLTAAMLMSTPAWADDAALLLGVERYDAFDRVVGAADIVEAEKALASVGFTVQSLVNGGASDTIASLVQFLEDAEGADRIVVGIAGQFVTDGVQTWFLPADAATPSLFAPGGVSMEAILSVLAKAPGQAVLAIGYDAGEMDAFDSVMRQGISTPTIPQGVTVVRGSPAAAVDFITDTLTVPGRNLKTAIAGNRRLESSGFLPDALTLVTEDAIVATPERPVASTATTDLAAEKALWDGARALDTVEAYRNYLARYPSGRFVAEAETLVSEITTEPNRPARLAEEALSLDRDALRDIQRDLTLLNFDPRGIDGIFGPGTRNAVKNWQQQNGYSQTTFLNAEQINRLDAQAARRSAELEAEAERARADQLRLDRAYWTETGAAGDEPGLRAYLERYPDGTFASEAKGRLNEFAAQKSAAAAAEDTAAWERAAAENTATAYQTYLQRFPDGALVAEAKARIAALTKPEQQDNSAAIAAETALGLNGITLRLIEARLAQLGLEPGEVDGGFDDDTRRAVRNFQRDRTLEVTGFLNEQTIVRLLADGFSNLGK